MTTGLLGTWGGLEEKEMKEEVEHDYKLSKPTPGDVLPPTMIHRLKSAGLIPNSLDKRLRTWKQSAYRPPTDSHPSTWAEVGGPWQV
ncbi:hypothetical protein LEMLEM_LOCUS27034 [Lemmus lemmus]